MAEGGAKSQNAMGLFYASLIIAGLLLLGKAYAFAGLHRWTAQVGIVLVWSAIALLAGNGRWGGFAGTAVVWLAVIVVWVI
jgi:hypothetical protein